MMNKRNITNSRSVTPPPKKGNIPRDTSPINLMVTQKSQKNLKNATLNNSNVNGSGIQTLENESESFKVYIRSRPISEKELSNVEVGKESNIIKKEDNVIFVLSTIKGKELRPREERSYVFNDIFDESVSTVEIYKKVLTPAVSHIMDGYNSTVLAYGMTGAGKTYTMFGDIYESGGVGVVTLMVKDLFEAFAKEEQDGYKCQMKFSYLEIYNEQVKDLLAQQTNENLMIIEDPVKGVYIPNLSSHNIDQCEDIINLIIKGNSKRAMASTNSNQFSSRSHAILQITVEKRQRARDIVESVIQSKLCLVDLAGSERAAVSENRGLRQMEGANINRSLLALGNCINVLSDPNTKGAFVPYRDSKLTRLLKDSLGGNTKTVMIACISPFYMAYEETVNTLKYASNARRIKRKIVKNMNEVEVHISEYRDIINSLKSEIDILKKQLQDNKGKQPQGSEVQVEIAVGKWGDKLLENLEENSQINQTLKELNVLKLQNEGNLKTKIQELEQSYHDVDVFTKVSQEIISLKRIMEDNERIEKEEQLNLQRNLEEKRELQGKILQLSDQKNQQNSHASYCQQLEKNLEMLDFERMNLWNQNNQVFQQAQLLAKEKAEKDDKILSLESLVYNMQLQLSEKDKLLEYNQQVITSILTQNLKGQIQSVANSFQDLENKESRDFSVALVNDKTLRDTKEVAKELGTPLPQNSEKTLRKTYQSKSLEQIKVLEVCSLRKCKSVSPRKLVLSSEKNSNEKEILTVPTIRQNKNNITSVLSCIASTPVEELSLDLSVKDLILDNFNSTRTKNPQKSSEKINQVPLPQVSNWFKPPLQNNVGNIATLLTTASSDQTLGYLDKLSKDLGDWRNTLVSSMGSELPKSDIQMMSANGKYSQQRDRLKEAKIASTNKTPRDLTKRSLSPISNVGPPTAQKNVPTLGMARDVAKNFKIKLNNVVTAAEKNMLESSCITLISQLAKEYNDYKAYLSENDFVILKKLGMVAIEKFGGGGSQPQMKNTRSNSSNTLAKRNKNLSTATMIVQEQNNKMPVSPVTPVAVTKKVAESEGKVLKKPTGKNLGKAGILSNINSDYSKALNKFCKNQSSGKPVQGKSINVATTHVICNQKNTNENSPVPMKESPQKEKLQEKDSASIIKALKMSMPVVEVSQFNPEINLNIINHNRAEMKEKMQKMREKFEQISKKTDTKILSTASESNNETKVEQATLEI